MFREQYKGAFNEINGDRSKIDKIFELAEKQSAPKKTKIIPFRYATTIAAAIVLVLAVGIYPNMDTFFQPEENVAGRQTENTEITEVKHFLDTQFISGEKEKETVLQDDQEKKPQTAYGVPETSNNASEQEKTEDTIAEDYSAKKVQTSENAEVTEKSEVATASFDEDRADAQVYVARMSLADSTANVPVSSEHIDFGEGKFASVCIYEKNDEIRMALENSENITVIGEAEVLITTEETVKNAVAKFNALYYSIETENLTDEEFDGLLNDTFIK